MVISQRKSCDLSPWLQPGAFTAHDPNFAVSSWAFSSKPGNFYLCHIAVGNSVQKHFLPISRFFGGWKKLSWVLFNRSIALSEICSISDLVNWKEKYYQVNSKNVSKRVFNMQLSSNIACWTNFYFIDWLGLSYLQLVFIYIIVYNVHDKIMNIFVHISDSLRIIRKCTKCQGKQKYRTIWNCFKNKYVISKYK